MKKFKIKYLLFIIIPVLFPTLIHLTFSYGEWDINPNNWESYSRTLAAFLLFVTFIMSVFFTIYINKEIDK